jgi:lipoprotein-releasing system permease protein
VSVGSIALLLSLSILNGFDEKLKATAIKFTSEISLQMINKSEIENVDLISAKVLEINGVKEVIPVLQTEGLAISKNYTEGISLQSIDTKNDFKNFKDKIIKGNFAFSSDSAKEIIIGEALAKKLNLEINDKILIYALKSKENVTFSSASYSQFQIKSIYQTGMNQYDEVVAFFPYATLANFLEKSTNSATYFEIFVNDLEKVNEISAEIDENLDYPFFPLTYYELNHSIFAWIDFQKAPIPLILAIISLVAALNIITMLIITVVEKSHSIGILRALGMRSYKIVTIFIFLGIRTAVIGLFIGIFLSLFFTFLQTKFSIITLDSKIYFLDKLPISMELQYIFGVFGLTLIFSFFASLIPAFIAVKVSPVKAINFK